jgi:hypothetical protein
MVEFDKLCRLLVCKNLPEQKSSTTGRRKLSNSSAGCLYQTSEWTKDIITI